MIICDNGHVVESPVWSTMRISSLNILIGCVVVFAFMPMAHAQKIPYDVAVRIIVGEGGNQDLKGMICIGEVLRHRASVKGFYGYQSNRIAKEPQSVWKQAARAWKQSAYTNYTKGADHFENIRQFGKPWWVMYCVKTYEYKDHVFYKEVPRIRNARRT